MCELGVQWGYSLVWMCTHFTLLCAERSVKHLVADGWYLSLSPVNVYVSADKIPVLMETPWVLVLWMAPLFLHSRVVWTVFWFPELIIAEATAGSAAFLCWLLSHRPDTDANSSWQTLKHTSNTPMVKFVKLLTALTARWEKKNNRICRRFSLFCFQIIRNMLEDWRCPHVFMKALGFEVVILPSADSLMGSYEIFTQCEVQPKCEYFMLNLSN